VKYPCTCRNYGCREIYKLDLIREHQQKCQYIPQPCPVNKLDIGNCTWTGISRTINLHLMQAHNVLMDNYGHGTLLIPGPFMTSSYDGHVSCGSCVVTPATRHCKLLVAYSVAFCSRSEIKNGIFYYVLQYIGPAAEAAKYQYTLQLFNEEYTENLAVSLLARSWDEDLSEVHNSGNCVKLYPEQFNRFANERSELAFWMEISKI